MKKSKKKKLRIKKKNLIIFTSSIIIIFLLVNISSSLIKKQLNTNIKNNKTETKDNKITEEDKKLNQLDNINTKINYFKYANIDRYLNYKEKNPTLHIEQVIIDVNIGLDYDYYTNTKETKDLNKEYILVNKYNYLKENYIPDNLDDIDLKYSRSGMKLVNYAKDAFETMAKDALRDNMTLLVTSSYRSYDYQVNLYNKYAASDGKEAADTYSARAGFSEHQTGLAVDIHNGKKNYTEFEDTKEFTWMQNNAYKYGFILRFPKDKVKETGYQYEAWHYRYVGKDAATYIHEHNITFEEYYVKFIEDKQ